LFTDNYEYDRLVVFQYWHNVAVDRMLVGQLVFCLATASWKNRQRLWKSVLL